MLGNNEFLTENFSFNTAEAIGVSKTGVIEFRMLFVKGAVCRARPGMRQRVSQIYGELP